jgi:hypothetical protein
MSLRLISGELLMDVIILILRALLVQAKDIAVAHYPVTWALRDIKPSS